MATTELAVHGVTESMTKSVAFGQRGPEAPWMSRIEDHPSWEILAQMRLTMRAEVSLDGFRVRDLLSLAEGQVFESTSPDTEDVPLKIGRVQLGWSEFEVVEERMALRLTRLS